MPVFLRFALRGCKLHLSNRTHVYSLSRCVLSIFCNRNPVTTLTQSSDFTQPSVMKCVAERLDIDRSLLCDLHLSNNLIQSDGIGALYKVSLLRRPDL